MNKILPILIFLVGCQPCRFGLEGSSYNSYLEGSERSIEHINSNRSAYDGKIIVVEGCLYLGFENNAICEDISFDHCLDVEFSENSIKEGVSQYDMAPVRIEGKLRLRKKIKERFGRDKEGHMFFVLGSDEDLLVNAIAMPIKSKKIKEFRCDRL